MYIEKQARLSEVCQREILSLIEDLESSPSRTAFLDVGTVAEVLVLANGIAEAEPMLRMLREAAARWLNTGLLEELVVARVEFAYHVALLSYLAQGAAACSGSSTHVIRALAEGRLIARNEIPALRQHLIAAYLSRCGIQADFGQIGQRNLAHIVDRRVLRSRSDEYDLLVLLMCAQIMQLERIPGHQRPRIFPCVLLVQAMRAANANWIPLLSFLCRRSFGMLDELGIAALESMQQSMPAESQLLPAPPANQLDSEYIERTGRGIRLRSTIALVLCFAISGEFHARKPIRTAFN